MGTADLLKRASIRMPGRSPGHIKAALTQPLKPSAAAVLLRATSGTRLRRDACGCCWPDTGSGLMLKVSGTGPGRLA